MPDLDISYAKIRHVQNSHHKGGFQLPRERSVFVGLCTYSKTSPGFARTPSPACLFFCLFTCLTQFGARVPVDAGLESVWPWMI